MPGLYFEELTVGRKFGHAVRRTVTEADNVFFSALTMNSAALHLDEEYLLAGTKKRVILGPRRGFDWTCSPVFQHRVEILSRELWVAPKTLQRRFFVRSRAHH